MEQPGMLSPTSSIFWPLLVGLAVSTALAQNPSGNELRSSVEEAVASIETTFDCDISVSGEPVFRQFSMRWELAFFASGMDCDAAYSELQRQVSPYEILLYRRPDLAQIKQLVAEIFSSVRSSGCQIAIREEPTFNESSGVWFVPYRASGSGCDSASEYLQDVGKERQIVFFRVVSREDLIR
jgi:hypothetical protein